MRGQADNLSRCLKVGLLAIMLALTAVFLAPGIAEAHDNLTYCGHSYAIRENNWDTWKAVFRDGYNNNYTGEHHHVYEHFL